MIFNRDRAVAKIVPIAPASGQRAGLVGSLAQTADVVGDIESPIAPADDWFSSSR